MDKAAFVIIHYGDEDNTRECLNSILINHAKNDPLIIVVINPGKELKTDQKQNSAAKNLKKSYPHLFIIENNENTGFARGNNIGIRKAISLGCEYILLLNNDTVVPLGLLDKLISVAKSDPGIGLVSPKIYFEKGYEYHKNRYDSKEKGRIIWYAGGIMDWANIYPSHRGVDEVDNGQYDETADTDFSTGCAMLIKRKTVENIGLFDEKYFMYYEDVDYSQRVRRSEMKVIYYPKAHLWHKNASSTGKPGSKFHIYYQNRNRLYFGFKYASAKIKRSLLLDSLKLLLRGGIYTKSITDYYLGKMGGAHL